VRQRLRNAEARLIAVGHEIDAARSTEISLDRELDELATRERACRLLMSTLAPLKRA
jgi:hypothetical protein